MDTRDQAGLRALRWRIDGLPVRIGQGFLIGGLAWLDIRSGLVLVWLAAASATALIDAALSERSFRRLGDDRLVLLNAASRMVSGGIFALIGPLFLIDRSGFGLTAAMLVGCAISLNNAMMTRGSRLFAFTLVGPSSAVLLTVPFAALSLGLPLSPLQAALLTVGAGAYAIFIFLLGSALNRESEALRTAVAAAEAASRAKSAFLAMTSHEIRTPLNGVLGMAQAMERDGLSAAQRERLATIRQSGEALLQILNDVLDLSKIEAGKLELECAPFDLEAVAREAHGVFGASALEKGLDYALHVDAEATGVYDGDPARVRQVLYNLISNALKFTDQGRVEVRVAVREGGVRLAVRDTGAGIAPDRAEALFDKFVQADSSTTRRFGGTGLGLAICRELCEAMGGQVSVESALGAGSVFIVDLPLARSASAAVARAAPATPLVIRPEAGGAPLRVLAAEDNAINQLVLRTLLQQVGLDPTIVETGAAAVEAWEAGVYDLILMDVQMPVMDGPAAARAIRRRERETGRPPIPIVALTANAMEHQAGEYLAAGMDAVVAKPIEIAELFSTIDRVVSAERPTPAAAQAAPA